MNKRLEELNHKINDLIAAMNDVCNNRLSQYESKLEEARQQREAILTYFAAQR